MTLNKLAGILLLGAGLSQAHLIDGSLEPKGGESLVVGQIVSIAWTVEQNHGRGIDIAFSKDGGATWKDIKTGYSDTETDNVFKWTVPADAVTAGGKLRVCQSGPCTDKQNVTKAEGNSSPWYLVSNAFAVQASSGIARGSETGNGLSLDFRPETRSVEVAFAADAGDRILLQAFDARGRLVATLIDGRFAAGPHKVSVFSNRLGSASGSLMFKLRVGDREAAHSWLMLR